MRRFFNPRRYRIVLFDQRGCGKSRPHASLVANTTWDLVADIERLREHLQIGRWQVFGGSWGSTLALAYAQTPPAARHANWCCAASSCCDARSSTGSTRIELGAASLFPDLWEKYVALIPPRERGNMMRAYYRRLTSKKPRYAHAPRTPGRYGRVRPVTCGPRISDLAQFSNPDIAAAFARIECHYFVNRGFLQREDQLLRGVRKIRHIPAVIVQGRYDVVCPMRSAWALHRAWPEADLRISATPATPRSSRAMRARWSLPPTASQGRKAR